MNETINYITSDLYLTAFLKVKGYKFKVEKNKLKYKFIFEDSAEILADVNDYLTESSLCEPLAYTNAIKNIKNLLYNL